MSVFNKINDFEEHVHHGVHDFANDQLAVALSNTAPGSETNDPSADGNGILANVTTVALNLKGVTPDNITTVSDGQTGGTYKLTLQDLTLTADVGGQVNFRYVYIYNKDSTGVANALICYFDKGSVVSLSEEDDQLDLDFDDVNGLFQST